MIFDEMTIEEQESSLVDWYQDLEIRLEGVGLSTRRLESTAGVELFNTDGCGYEPDFGYVIDALVKVEERYGRQLRHGNYKFL